MIETTFHTSNEATVVLLDATKMVMVEQNIFIASSLAILGGCCQVLTVLILAYPEFRRGQGKEFSEAFERLLVPFNLLFQGLVGVVNTSSTWYGPVSVIMPMRVSSQLLFNMLFFESLGIEEFTKDVRIGTFIVVTAAFILPVVGPTVQQEQDVVSLLEHWTSEVWALFLVVLMFITGSYCILFFIRKSLQGENNITHDNKTFILLTARVISAVLSASISKLLVVTTGYAFLYSVLGYVFCAIIISTVAILQATEVDQNSFVPASACGIQFVNAITGLIIWQDWKVVQSWSGYSLVMLQIVLGVYLIASEDKFINSADTDFSLTQSFTIQAAKDISRRSLFLSSNQRMNSYAGGNLNTMLQSFRQLNESIGDEGRPLNTTGYSLHKYSSLHSIPSGNDTVEADLSTTLSLENESDGLSYETSNTKFDAAVPEKKRFGLIKKFLPKILYQ